MPDAKGKITDADRLLLSAVMDRIVPAVEGLAGAGELGLAGKAEEIAQRIPRYQDSLFKMLSALSLDPASRVAGGFLALELEEQTQSLEALELSMTNHFNNFVELIYTAYYSDARVHQRIGWRTGALQPLGWELKPFDPAILETVSKRTPFWRRV